MAAINRQELMDVHRREYEKLQVLLVQVTPKTALKKREDDTSIKDVIAHRAHWIDLFFGWYADGLAGKPVFFPAKGYKWNDLKRYNADLRVAQADMGWPAALAMLNSRFEKLSDFIRSHSDAQLYGGPMKGAKNAWTAGRWAEAAGPSHFRSASKYIRACLREDAKAEG